MTAGGRRLALVLALGALLRLPSFRYDVISDDEATYDAMARVVDGGGVMYRDAVDHKPPGLVYTYAMIEPARASPAVQMLLVHLAGLLAALATALVLGRLARRLLAPGLEAWPPLLYLVFSTAMQPADGLAVNGELLMNLPTALAVWAALAATDARGARRLGLDLAAGALVAGAALYKYQGALVGVALLALVDRRDRAAWIVRPAAWLCGFAAPFAGCALYFHGRGALADAIGWGLGFNAAYLAEGPPLGWALERLAMQLAGVVLPAALLFAGGVRTTAAIARGGAPEVQRGRGMLVAWCWLALAAVALGGRFFGHYFLQPELPLALAAAGPAARLYARARGALVALIAVPCAAWFAVAALPQLSRPLFHALDPDYAAIGRAVQARTSPDETIWVWGNVPQIYHAAGRRLGVRFPFCNYITGLSPGTPSEYDPAVDPAAHADRRALALALDDLRTRRPRLVLDTAAVGLKSYGKFPIAAYPALAQALAAGYVRDGDAAGVPVWRRAD